MFHLKWKSVPAWHSPFGARCVYGYMAQDALGSERRKQCMCGRRNLPRIFSVCAFGGARELCLCLDTNCKNKYPRCIPAHTLGICFFLLDKKIYFFRKNIYVE